MSETNNVDTIAEQASAFFPGWQGRRVLVTGAAGFIGRHVALACAKRGAVVFGAGHGVWATEEWKQWGLEEWLRADIDGSVLARSFTGVEVVFHCAGSASVGASVADPAEDFRRTVDSTAQALEFVRAQNRPCAFVYPSSAGVYGQTTQIPTPESAPTHPISPYGTHKLLAEQLVLAHAKQFATHTAIVRLFSVYGAGLRRQLLWDACGKLASGETSFMGTGEEVRDWLHVEDAASLLLTAAEHASTACLLLNGGTGIGVSVREILQQLSTTLGVGGQIAFTGKIRSGDPDRYVANIEKAKGYGWAPRCGWADGVNWYAEWWKQQSR